MKRNIELDLLIMVIASVSISLIGLFTTSIIRPVLAIPYFFFVPGYTLVSALFPNNSSLDKTSKFGISVVLSIVLIVFIGIIMNSFNIGLYLRSILIAISLPTLILSLIAWYRRKANDKSFHLKLEFHFSFKNWGQYNKLSYFLSILCISAVVCAIIVTVYVFSSHRSEQRFEEFYCLDFNKETRHFPSIIGVTDGEIIQIDYGKSNDYYQEYSDSVKIYVGISNRDISDRTYYIDARVESDTIGISINGQDTNSIGPIYVQQEMEWEQLVEFYPIAEVGLQRVDFNLYEYSDEQTELIQSIYISFEVEEI